MNLNMNTGSAPLELKVAIRPANEDRHEAEMTEEDGNEGRQEQQRQAKQGVRSLFRLLVKDSRKLIHAFKVGLALSLSSLFMLVEEPPKLLGQNAIWAIMTVVVVFEFSVGATLSKGLNRGLGTLAAAFLGLGISHLADVCGGQIGEAAIIIASVFMSGGVATFLRFIPKLKAKFDYGLVIFILTFSLISVSSYQTEDSFKTASTRMFTILVGCGISLVICMFLLPVWAGEDLHDLVSGNFETLANCIRGSVEEYIKKPATNMQAVMEKDEQNRADNDEIYVKYRMLLSSSQTEDNLINFAGWEPPHGKFLMFGYPWKQYSKVGAALRHCAYASMALHGCLRSEVQAPYELRKVFRSQLMKVTKHATQLLKVLGESVHKMEKCQHADALLTELTTSTECLQESIDAHSQCFINPGMIKWALVTNPSFEYNTDSLPGSPYCPQQNEQQHSPCTHRLGSYTSLSMRSIRSASNFSLATFASLLIETVARIENLVETVDNLAELARFKDGQQQHKDHIVVPLSTRSGEIFRQNAANNTDGAD